MRYTWLDEYLLEKAGVTKDLQKDWNWIRYSIGGKMFAAVCLGDDNEPYYITLKLEPAEGDFLRQQPVIAVAGVIGQQRLQHLLASFRRGIALHNHRTDK